MIVKKAAILGNRNVVKKEVEKDSKGGM